MTDRMEAVDWERIGCELDDRGYATIRSLVAIAECGRLAAAFNRESAFRSHVVMARHGYGRGEYRYFSYPLPDIVQELEPRFIHVLSARPTSGSNVSAPGSPFPAATPISSSVASPTISPSMGRNFWGGRLTTLSTHVLDTAAGKPAPGLAISLHQGDALLFEGRTDADGRCRDLPAITPGLYALRFAAGDHFRRAGLVISEPPFLDIVEIRFGVSKADGHYHVPLIVSPFGYSTYRGS